MTAPTVRPVPAAGVPATRGLEHIVCACDDNTALCGYDVTDHQWKPRRYTPDNCVVCEDLDLVPCGRCGQ